ncbi:MAG: triose-phosphate isomerase, partial [Nitrospirota bacterium]
MFSHFKQRHKSLPCRMLSAFTAFTFSFSYIVPPVYAQGLPATVMNLPVPGTPVPLTPGFTPARIIGMTIHADNPLMFDFMVDPGDVKLNDQQMRDESLKLVKYFLASLTVPAEKLWVNLSPYEKDKIVPEEFGQTEMGAELLAQDYMLKQLTASLMNPEDELGKKFWDRVYEKAQKLFGTTEIPMNTFNKVWIVPEKAVVYANGLNVFVLKSRLKVMLEEDYLALQHHTAEHPDAGSKDAASGISSSIIKEVLLPEIEKEVNEGKTFANLRQIYNSMILASWYKQNLKESFLGQIYANKNKTDGLTIKDKETIEKLYNQYVEAFEKGVHNFIKEDYDPVTKQIIPRKYFSGGGDFKGIDTLVGAAIQGMEKKLRDRKTTFGDLPDAELMEFVGLLRKAFTARINLRSTDGTLTAEQTFTARRKNLLVNNHVAILAQRISAEFKGAGDAATELPLTGQLSAVDAFLAGATGGLAGHSEARDPVKGFRDTDLDVLKQLRLLHEFKFGDFRFKDKVFLFGEPWPARKDGTYQNFVRKQVQAVLSGIGEVPGLTTEQVSNTVFAYEPVWSIGTGESANPQQAQEMAKLVRDIIAEINGRGVADKVTILYGGSVTQSTAQNLIEQPDIDGFLVGGASNKIETFKPIIDIVAAEGPTNGRIPVVLGNHKTTKVAIGAYNQFVADMQPRDTQRIRTGLAPTVSRIGEVVEAVEKQMEAATSSPVSAERRKMVNKYLQDLSLALLSDDRIALSDPGLIGQIAQDTENDDIFQDILNVLLDVGKAIAGGEMVVSHEIATLFPLIFQKSPVNSFAIIRDLALLDVAVVATKNQGTIQGSLELYRWVIKNELRAEIPGAFILIKNFVSVRNHLSFRDIKTLQQEILGNNPHVSLPATDLEKLARRLGVAPKDVNGVIEEYARAVGEIVERIPVVLSSSKERKAVDLFMDPSSRPADVIIELIYKQEYTSRERINELRGDARKKMVESSGLGISADGVGPVADFFRGEKGLEILYGKGVAEDLRGDFRLLRELLETGLQGLTLTPEQMSDKTAIRNVIKDTILAASSPVEAKFSPEHIKEIKRIAGEKFEATLAAAQQVLRLWGDADFLVDFILKSDKFAINNLRKLKELGDSLKEEGLWEIINKDFLERFKQKVRSARFVYQGQIDLAEAISFVKAGKTAGYIDDAANLIEFILSQLERYSADKEKVQVSEQRSIVKLLARALLETSISLRRYPEDSLSSRWRGFGRMTRLLRDMDSAEGIKTFVQILKKGGREPQVSGRLIEILDAYVPRVPSLTTETPKTGKVSRIDSDFVPEMKKLKKELFYHGDIAKAVDALRKLEGLGLLAENAVEKLAGQNSGFLTRPAVEIDYFTDRGGMFPMLDGPIYEKLSDLKSKNFKGILEYLKGAFQGSEGKLLSVVDFYSLAQSTVSAIYDDVKEAEFYSKNAMETFFEELSFMIDEEVPASSPITRNVRVYSQGGKVFIKETTVQIDNGKKITVEQDLLVSGLQSLSRGEIKQALVGMSSDGSKFLMKLPARPLYLLTRNQEKEVFVVNKPFIADQAILYDGGTRKSFRYVERYLAFQNNFDTDKVKILGFDDETQEFVYVDVRLDAETGLPQMQDNKVLVKETQQRVLLDFFIKRGGYASINDLSEAVPVSDEMLSAGEQKLVFRLGEEGASFDAISLNEILIRTYEGNLYLLRRKMPVGAKGRAGDHLESWVVKLLLNKGRHVVADSEGRRVDSIDGSNLRDWGDYYPPSTFSINDSSIKKESDGSIKFLSSEFASSGRPIALQYDSEKGEFIRDVQGNILLAPASSPIAVFDGTNILIRDK